MNLIPIFGWADAMSQIPGLLDAVMKSVQGTQNSYQCSFTSDSPESFTSRSQFISYVCQNSKTMTADALIENLRARGGTEAVSRSSSGEITFSEFAEGLKFFLASNASIPKQFGVVSPSDWSLGQFSPELKCKYSIGENRVAGAEMKFKNLSFNGVAHFSEMKDSDLPLARKDLKDRLSKNNPNALIIEGFKFGQPLPCEQVLSAVFTPEAETHREWDMLQKFGFLNRIPMIPADSQRVEDSDIPIFFSNNKNKAEQTKKDIQFVDVLHFYYEALQGGSKKPLDQAISNAQSMSPDPIAFNVDKFKSRYKELNGGELPTDFNLIRQDFTPSAYLQNPKGTNRLADLQDALRNQSLLRAIQIATKKYSRPMVVFGSGHLAAIGNDLEKNIGTPVNVDFKNSCR